MPTRPKGAKDSDDRMWGLSDVHDELTYLDSREFRAYAALLEQIILTAPSPGELCTRELHEQLGDRARREWTQDALDSLNSVEAVGILPTRYRRTTGILPVARATAHGSGFRNYPLTPLSDASAGHVRTGSDRVL